MILQESFYTGTDVVHIAKALLGKVLVTRFDGVLTSGIIVETEAYAGVTDKASHAYGGRNTARTSVMYMQGGVSYVYLCYGIHHLFNVVTNVEGIPHAVLIRAIEPLEGIDAMLLRRKLDKVKPSLTAGPGAMSQALGITTKHTAIFLQSPELHIEDRGIIVGNDDIVASTRVGVAYAAEDALLPYRYSLKGNPYVSRGKGL
jgi:DNA-3-methyladenine glycosylase